MTDGTPPPNPRQRLLETLVGHLERHGLADTSLRGMAEAIGTSHRMLSYHFKSRQALLVEVSREVERRQREAFEAMLADPPGPVAEVMWAMHERFADPALHSAERLFFELYARALLDPDDSAFIPEVVEAWLEPVARLFAGLELTEAEARAEARLALATSRGLILDLLATGDRAAVDAVMRRYVRRFEAPATEAGAAGSGVVYALVAEVPPDGVEAFRTYEQQVLPLLADHGARLERRVATADGRTEVHLLRFPSAEALEHYRADPRRQAAAPGLERSGATLRLLPVRDVA